MIGRVFNPVLHFLSWWGRELADLVPGAWSPARGSRGWNTVISAEKSRLQLVEERSGAGRIVATAELWPGAARRDPLEGLDPIGVKGVLGLRVPYETCFVRTVQIPAAAAADAAAIAALDLERATPFRSADVMTAVLIDRSVRPVRGTVPVRQLVLKRETVQPILDALAARGLEAKFIDCWTPDRSAAMPLDFLASVRSASAMPSSPQRGLKRALAAAAVFGLVTAIGTVLVKQTNALAALEVETKAVRQSAVAAGERISRADAAVADAVRLRELKSRRPLAVAVLDQVTRLLPDGAYLSEFILEGDQLDLAGFATSAAPLLEIFETSPQFTDARFSAPFRYDSREERERFSMRVRVKPAVAANGGPPKEPRK